MTVLRTIGMWAGWTVPNNRPTPGVLDCKRHYVTLYCNQMSYWGQRMAECETRLSQHCSSGILRHLPMYMKSSCYTIQTTPELYMDSFKTLPRSITFLPYSNSHVLALSDATQWQTVVTTELRKFLKKLINTFKNIWINLMTAWKKAMKL